LAARSGKFPGEVSLEIKTVIIKVTNDCNLNCRYCFVDKSAPRNMLVSREAIVQLIEELEIHSPEDEIDLVWHGGEPMLAGIDFFRNMIDIQQGCKKKYTNSIQTNGTLLTRDRISSLYDLRFKIGISIDGPRGIHDTARTDAKGRGSFDQVKRSLDMLKEFVVPFGVIATISRCNVDRAEDLYSFCKELRVPLKLSPLYISGNAVKNIDSLKITPEEYARFLLRLSDLWMNDPEPAGVINLESFLQKVIANDQYAGPCTFIGDCHRRFLAMGPSGDLYPCGMYQGFGRYKYGNIFQTSISDISRTGAWSDLQNRSAALEKQCGQCAVKAWCNGGCSFHSLAAFGRVDQRDYFCKAYRQVIPALVDMVHDKLTALRTPRIKKHEKEVRNEDRGEGESKRIEEKSGRNTQCSKQIKRQGCREGTPA